MIIAVDIETEGLDARKFVLASLVKDTGRKMIFYDKKKLWNYIIELGKKQASYGHILLVYSHNASYDFYGYADLYDTNLRLYSHHPFIGVYLVDGKEKIKFLDTSAIYSFGLKKVGKMIGLPKMEMPDIIKDEFVQKDLFGRSKPFFKKDMKELEEYCIRDSEICLESINYLKRILKRDGIKLNRYYTISQIAVSHFIQWLSKHGEYDDMFRSKERRSLVRSKYNTHIHYAYRYGRVEAFQTGDFDNVYNVDVNNLYGYIASIMEFPDLNTEHFEYNPLRYSSVDTVLSGIGVTKCLLYNRKNDLGLIPVRSKFGNYFPKSGSYILGVYTNYELRKALNEGYDIVNIEWTVNYGVANKNPFAEYIPYLFKKRIESTNEIDIWFYKQLQNHCFGKLAQRKPIQYIFFDSVEKVLDYEKEGVRNLYSIDGEYLNAYKVDQKRKLRKFYCPIIPTLVNSIARCYMYDFYKKIPMCDLLYTDTDNVVFKGNHLNKFPIGKDLGRFKVENRNTDALIYTRKTYRVGDDIRSSGIHKSYLKREDFDIGYLKETKMLTLNNCTNAKLLGSFFENIRDLNKSRHDNIEKFEKLGDEILYMDLDFMDYEKYKFFMEDFLRLNLSD